VVVRGSPGKNSAEALHVALKMRTVDFSDAEVRCGVCQEATYGASGSSATCDRCRRRFHTSCGVIGPFGPDGEVFAFCERCITRQGVLELYGE
jgi:hypothetical protein